MSGPASPETTPTDSPVTPEFEPEPEPVMLVEPSRPLRQAWKFLPPLMILPFCVGFLAYRVSRADWRGVFSLIDRVDRPAPARPGEQLARASGAEAETDTAPATPEARGQVAGPGQAEAEPPPAPAPSPATGQAEADIAREAEETRKRIAELERQKEEAARKLAETEDQRRRAAPRQPHALPPAEIDRRLAMQREILRRQVEEMQRRQMAWMEETQRRHAQQFEEFRRRAQENAQGFGRRDPFGMPPGVGPAPFFGPPRFPEPAAPPADRPARERRFNVPGGNGWVREYQGPDGSAHVEFHWRSSTGANPPDVPPPPAPGRIFD